MLAAAQYVCPVLLEQPAGVVLHTEGVMMRRAGS
jgi:hypothetical protein